MPHVPDAFSLMIMGNHASLVQLLLSMLPVCYIYIVGLGQNEKTAFFSFSAQGKVPLCTYCSVCISHFLLKAFSRHPSLECPFRRSVRVLCALGCDTFPVSDAP